MKSTGLGRGLSALLPHKIPAKAAAEEKGVFEVPIEAIVPNPRQPRENFGSGKLEELASSVRQHGILQPLIVAAAGAGRYELIAGERRFKAAQAAGLKTVPVVVRSVSDVEKLELALIENLQRENLNPVEEARAYQALTEEFDLTQEAIAGRVGKSRPYVANLLRVLTLPEEVRQALIDGRLNQGSARALLALDTPQEQLALFRKILEHNLTVREVEAASRARGRRPFRRRSLTDPKLLAAEETLRAALGTKVVIVSRRGKGHVRIEFYSEEELNEILNKLQNCK